MEGAGKFYEPVTYEGAGHGFMRTGEETNAAAANSAANESRGMPMKNSISQGRLIIHRCAGTVLSISYLSSGQRAHAQLSASSPIEEILEGQKQNSCQRHL